MTGMGRGVKKLKHFLTEPVRNGYSPVCVNEPTGKKVLGLGALTGEGFNPAETKWVPADNIQADNFIIHPGDFLVSRSNTLDKVGRAALYEGGLENCSYPDLMMKFRVDEKKVFPRFIAFVLQSDHARKYFMRRASGTSGSMVKLTKSAVEEIEIPLLPLPEQMKIAAILKTWDEGIEKTEQILATKQKQFEGLQNNLMKEQECALPEVEFGNFVKFSPTKKLSSTAGEKLLTVKLHCLGVEASMRETANVTEKGRPYYKRNAGEFIIGRQNFHNGGFGIVPPHLDGFIASNAITSLDVNADTLDIDFLFYFMSRKNYYLRVGHIMDGTGQKELSDRQIVNLPLVVPDIEKQRSISRTLKTARREIEALQDLVFSYRNQKRGLMQKLLTGAGDAA